MTATNSERKRRSHLRLVPSDAVTGDPQILTDPMARKEFEQLTERLLDLAIEIIDLADGDPEIEPNGDESEPDDGV